MSDVTNWGGTILDREILNHLQKGDMVRIIIDSYKNKPYFSSRYVRITNVLPNGYFKANVEDSYNTYIIVIIVIKKEQKGIIYIVVKVIIVILIVI